MVLTGEWEGEEGEEGVLAVIGFVVAGGEGVVVSIIALFSCHRMLLLLPGLGVSNNTSQALLPTLTMADIVHRTRRGSE